MGGAQRREPGAAAEEGYEDKHEDVAERVSSRSRPSCVFFWVLLGERGRALLPDLPLKRKNPPTAGLDERPQSADSFVSRRKFGKTFSSGKLHPGRSRVPHL